MDSTLSFDRQKAPARRGEAIRVDISAGSGELITLTGPASFSPDSVQHRVDIGSSDASRQLEIHSTGRPGRVILKIGTERHILRFEAAGFVQGIIYDWAPTLGLSVLLALVLRSFAFASYYVPSPSMVGTLYPGDKFIAEKFSTKVLNRSPQRGEIVIFHHPEHPHETWVKRVIGLPGDLVEIRNGSVWINNERIQEDYIKDDALNDYGPVSVPEGNYFVLGDNRNNSLDSRIWGYLPEEYIEGSPVLVFWPPRHARSLRAPGQQNSP